MPPTEDDQRFMEHTEKLVADMLKYVLAPNNNNNDGCQNEIEVEANLEYVIIDETGMRNPQTTPETVEYNEATTYENSEDIMNNQLEGKFNAHTQHHHHSPNPNESELDRLITDGLNKIREEYPIYPTFTNPYVYNSWQHAALPAFCMSPLNTETFENSHIPLNNWYVNSLDASGDGACPNVYQEEVNRALYGDEIWEDSAFDEDDVPFEWSNAKNVPNNEPLQSQSQSHNVIIEEPPPSDDENENEYNANTKNAPTNFQEERNFDNFIPNEMNQVPNNNRLPHCIMNADKITENNLNTATTATHIQLCAGGPQAALHAAQSTTTTTTANAFGVLHQQTSCTTTNFVSNNIANATLANLPAALYAQSLLASTAQQYLNAILKESQQFNNNTNNVNVSNINIGIYERIFYAQLLQQQLLQQQQQQAAIAALLQQQKIVMQTNAAAAAAAAATVAAAAVNVNAVANNTDVVASNVNAASSTNSVVSMSPNDCGNSSVISLKNSINTTNEISKQNNNNNNINKNINNYENNVVEMNSNSKYHTSLSRGIKKSLKPVKGSNFE